MQHPGIRARAITRSFRGSSALAGVDLDVEPGAIVVVTGANGAGKTTLLRILATLLVPHGGDAWVAGRHVVAEAEAVRRAIGTALVNDRGLYWRMSARQNLAFFGRLAGVGPVQITSALRTFGLEPIADRRVGTYSAGQRQRLVLARATIAAPAVLLFDEPLRGLDEEGIAVAGAVLRSQAARGAAVLVTAPTTEGLREIADEVVRLHEGRIGAHEEAVA